MRKILVYMTDSVRDLIVLRFWLIEPCSLASTRIGCRKCWKPVNLLYSLFPNNVYLLLPLCNSIVCVTIFYLSEQRVMIVKSILSVWMCVLDFILAYARTFDHTVLVLMSCQWSTLLYLSSMLNALTCKAFINVIFIQSCINNINTGLSPFVLIGYKSKWLWL